jgi:hypothetical protein
MIDVIRAIGTHLRVLQLGWLNVEEVDEVIECCPNLQTLTLRRMRNIHEASEEEAIGLSKINLKKGLRKLSKLIVNEEIVRLGTNWKGNNQGEINGTRIYN